MFGGSNNNGNNHMLPVLLDENRLQYQSNAPNHQLQLFGNLASGCTVDLGNYFGSEKKAPMLRPNKRVRDFEDLQRQQKLQISLNYNLCQGELDRPTSIPNQNHVSTGLKLSYDDDERNSSVSSASGSLTGGTSLLLSLGDSLRSELERQNDEFDQYIKLQEEHLAKGVRDLKQRQMTSILTTLEKGIKNKLRQKELEIESMNHKNKELAERIKQTAAEAQNWHYRAKYNESVVNVLKNNLQQVLSQGSDQGKEGFGDSEVDDAASYKDPGYGKAAVLKLSNEHLICKSCRSKEVTVLLMPCRHLCLCKSCDGLVRACPVCNGVKAASVEVYLS